MQLRINECDESDRETSIRKPLCLTRLTFRIRATKRSPPPFEMVTKRYLAIVGTFITTVILLL